MAGVIRRFRDAGAVLGRFLRHQQIVLFALGLGVGALAGGGAIAFRDLIGAIQYLGFGFSSERVVSLAGSVPWWQIVLVPVLGGLAVGLFIHFAMPDRRHRAVADVMEATALRGGRISLRAGLTAALASAASIGTGASVGREGPVVHLGATLASFLSRRLRLSRNLTLTLIGCGVASAIAASFNAPIAGVIFALEVVVGHYALSSFAPIVIAAVTGTVIARLYYGNFPAFIIPDRAITSFWEFPAFALLGIVCAVIAVAFIEITLRGQQRVAALPGPAWAKPAAAGLVVGVIALWFPHILGVGYETTDIALAEGFPLHMLAILLVLKFGVTALCLSCGFAGGVFSPALVMGALAGGVFGIIATAAFPDLSSGSGAYTIVGMGAVAGAVMGAPISTILIVFELTSNFALTIAVMVGVVIASTITHQVTGGSFFTRQLSMRGISLAGGRETGLLRSGRVSDLMHDAEEKVDAAMPLADVRRHLVAAPHNELFVVDAEGRLTGTITLGDLSEVAFDTSHDALLKAVDVARANPPVVELGADLEEARHLLASAGEDQVAVVANRDNMHLVGYLREHDVMDAYHRAVAQARAEERGEA